MGGESRRARVDERRAGYGALGAQRAAAIASARKALGEHEFERLLAEGRHVLNDAIAYALEDETD